MQMFGPPGWPRAWEEPRVAHFPNVFLFTFYDRVFSGRVLLTGHGGWNGLVCLFESAMSKPYTFGKNIPCLKAQAVMERVHFKPMFEVGRAIKGMTAEKALEILRSCPVSSKRT